MGRLDEAAFAAFHARSARALRAHVCRVLGNAPDADDRWRRRKHEQGENVMPEQVSAHPHYENDASVASIFAQLKPRDRALLWLAYVEGESHEEIASSLGVGRRGVKVMLFRARKLIAQWEAERRAQWPLDIMLPLEIAGGLAAAGLLLYLSRVG